MKNKQRLGYGNRGMGLERYIEVANRTYLHRGIAVIKKIPTPVKVRRLDKLGKIKEGWFEKGELVDYLGAYDGKAVAFDAKSTRVPRLPLENIEEHQYNLLKNYHKQGGFSFLIVEFPLKHEIYLLNFKDLQYWWEQKENGRKSIPYSFFQDNCKQVKSGQGIALDYLTALEIKENA